MRNIVLILVFICCSTVLFSQTRVNGVVKDETGGVLIGVTVMQKNTLNGTVTDLDGHFELKLDNTKEPVLQLSMIGFVTAEVNVEGKANIDVILKEETIGLEEVVVIGYGTQKKVSVTGAISNVTSEEITNTPVSSVTNSLAGRIPGLVTRQVSGRPGDDGSQLFIRGTATFNNSEPLTLVDGVERAFNQINAEDIESVSVLKDASATAVYGVRGANGVILITTKRGSVGKSKIGFTAEYGITNYNRLTKALDAETTSLFQREGTVNMGLDPSKMSNTSNFPVSEYDNYLYRTQLSPFTHPDNDFVETFTKPGTQQKYNINISGGNNVTKYFVSVGYFTQQGMFESRVSELRERPIIKNLLDLSPQVDAALKDQGYDASYYYNRLTARSNIDISLTDDLKVGVNISYLHRKQNRPATYDGLGSNAEGLRLFASFYRNAPQAFPLMNPNGSFAAAIGVWRQNPLVTIAHTGFRSDYDNQLETTLNFEYDLRKIFKGLSLDGRYAFDVNWSSWRGMQQRPYLYSYNPKDNSYLQGLVGVLPFQDSGNAAAIYDQYMELALRYSGVIGDVHNLSGVLLTNFTSTSSPGGQYSYVPHVYQALIGRVNYDYDNKYLAEINMGYNGSNRFAKGRRYHLFPAMSLGWVITNENFMPQSDILNFVKLRTSLGQVGNDRLGGFSYYYKSTYVNGESYSFGETPNPNVVGLREGRMANENITWETATKYNVGIDTRWFDSKLSFSADVFKEQRKDILTEPARYIIASGVTSLAPENLGEVTNSGYELELGWQSNRKKDFNYFAKITYSYAKNKIIEMSEARKPFDYMYLTGQSVGQFMGYNFDGFFNSYEEIAASPQQFGLSNLAPGDIKYKDINRDGIVDQNDQTPIGYSNLPERTYSLSAGFDYKGFDLSLLFQGASHSSVYMAGDVGWDNSWGNYFEEHLYRWTPETASTATYPRFLQKSDGNNQNYYLSDFWLRDGKYLRLKNIQIGYNIPKRAITRTPMNSVYFYVNAYNLFTWDKVKRIDPESNPDRNVGQFYPQQNIINFGLKINF